MENRDSHDLYFLVFCESFKCQSPITSDMWFTIEFTKDTKELKIKDYWNNSYFSFLLFTSTSSYKDKT